MEVNRYRDQYGSWIRVSHPDLDRVGFADEVHSKESRMTISWVYLYGDEGVRFLYRAREVVGDVEVFDAPPVEKSTIRKMARFQRRFLMFVPMPGRLIRMNGRLWRITKMSRKRGAGSIHLEQVQTASPDLDVEALRAVS